MKFSKEEILKILEGAKDEQGNVPFAIAKKAIEKLKVEPDWIPVSEGLPNKIRTEIERTRKIYLDMNDIDWINGCDYVLSVIDKYKAESEEIDADSN